MVTLLVYRSNSEHLSPTLQVFVKSGLNAPVLRPWLASGTDLIDSPRLTENSGLDSPSLRPILDSDSYPKHVGLTPANYLSDMKVRFMAGNIRCSRRDILIAGSSAAAVWFQGPTWLQAAEPAAAVRLVADSSKSLFRVHVEMDLEGNVNLPANALVSKAKQRQLPVKAKSILDWEERSLAFSTDRSVQAAERYYYDAKSEGTIGKQERKVELRPESRLVHVRRLDPKWVMYSPESYLSGEELELLELPACSLAVDSLLPTTEVKIGHTYKPENSALCKLLSLAAVNESDVVAEVNTLDASQAKIHLKGKVEGSIGGVPTTMELVGKLLFDREQLAVTWLAIAVHERRDIGKLEPGFDVAATIKMIRKPLAAPVKLPAQTSKRSRKRFRLIGSTPKSPVLL